MRECIYAVGFLLNVGQGTVLLSIVGVLFGEPGFKMVRMPFWDLITYTMRILSGTSIPGNNVP